MKKSRIREWPVSKPSLRQKRLQIQKRTRLWMLNVTKHKQILKHKFMHYVLLARRRKRMSDTSIMHNPPVVFPPELRQHQQSNASNFQHCRFHFPVPRLEGPTTSISMEEFEQKEQTQTFWNPFFTIPD